MFKWGLLFGLVVTLIGYGAIAMAVAQQLTRARRRYPYTEPGAVGLEYEDIWFPARGEALNIGAWHLPSPGATRAVVIVHGLNGCRRKVFPTPSFALLAHLVRSGFTVLALDLRGHGESDLAPLTYGSRERADVLGAVDWLLARGYAPGAIGVLGVSMGGVAAIGATVEEPAIGALIIDSAFADFTPMMRTHFRKYSKLPIFFLPGALLVASLLSSESLAQLRPVKQMSALTCRSVLIIHACGDQLVPVAHGQELAQAGNTKLWLTNAANHLGSFGADPLTYSNRVTLFFTDALASSPAYTLSTPIIVPQVHVTHEIAQEAEQCDYTTS